MGRKKNLQEPEEDEVSEPKEPEGPKYDLSALPTDPVNRAPIRVARDLFFKEYTYEHIFLKTGVPPSVFAKRSKTWAKIRDKVDEKVIQKIRQKAVSQQSKEFIEKGLQVGLKFINRLLKREDEITPKDWKLVSDSIMALHRVHQLELGKPTDISVYENMTPQQIQEYLLEIQKQTASKHDMSMFSTESDIPEEELLAEYAKSKDDTGIH